MANNFIGIDTTKRLGAVTYNTATQLADARDRLVQLKNDMDNMVDGADYSVIATQFGVANGQTLYNLVAGAASALTSSSDLTNLLNWLAVAR